MNWLVKILNDVDQHASRIRRRVDELVQQLGITFPVYIVFTKSDLWKGFVEFFSELDSHDREQVWGTTFALNQAEGTSITDLFNQEFDLLSEHLIAKRSEILSRQRNRSERHHVFVFPLQFTEAKKNLARFVSRVFQPNPYQETPIFRGFYFTSGTQEGVPMLNEVINSIAQSFGLSPNSKEEGSSTKHEKRSYFIKELFTKVIIPDQYLVSKTKRTKLWGAIRQAAVSSAAIGGLVLFLMYLTFAFAQSKRNLNRTSEALATTAAVNWENDQNIVTNLSHMIVLQNEIEDARGFDRQLLLGLDRGRKFAEPAQQHYTNLSRSFVQSYVYEGLLASLEQKIRKASLDGLEKQTLYEDIKTLLLLTSQVSRLEEEGYDSYLVSRITEVSGDVAQPVIALSGQATHSEQMNILIREYVEALKENPEIAFPSLNQTQLSRARRLVDQSQTVNTVYARIVRSPDALQLPSVQFNDIAGSGNEYLFASDPTVPGIYTKTGWGYFKDAIDRETKNPSREDWVLGRSASASSQPDADPKVLTQELEALFFDNYAQAWMQFLERIQYTPASDLQNISSNMGILGDRYTSPLIAVLSRVTFETTFQTESEVLGNAVGGVLNNTKVPGGKAGMQQPVQLSRLSMMKSRILCLLDSSGSTILI